jgi:hypothetical protein
MALNCPVDMPLPRGAIVVGPVMRRPTIAAVGVEGGGAVGDLPQPVKIPATAVASMTVDTQTTIARPTDRRLFAVCENAEFGCRDIRRLPTHEGVAKPARSLGGRLGFL